MFLKIGWAVVVYLCRMGKSSGRVFAMPLTIAVSALALFSACEEKGDEPGGDPSATPTATTAPLGGGGGSKDSANNRYTDTSAANSNRSDDVVDGNKTATSDTGTGADQNDGNPGPELPTPEDSPISECKNYVVKGAGEWGASLREAPSATANLKESLANGSPVKRAEPPKKDGSYLKVVASGAQAMEGFVDEVNLQCADDVPNNPGNTVADNSIPNPSANPNPNSNSNPKSMPGGGSPNDVNTNNTNNTNSGGNSSNNGSANYECEDWGKK